MGGTENGASSKLDKVMTSVQDQTNVNAYPDWTTVQAYYGPGVGIPPPYFSSAVASGQASHPYMWGAQPMISPYGPPPYAAIYSHGGVYAHSPVSFGSHLHGHGIAPPTTTEPMMVHPLNIETPSKSSSSRDESLIKKIKGLDGLAVSVGNGNAENAGGSVPASSQSIERNAEVSSDGSDVNAIQDRTRSWGKRRSESLSSTDNHGKVGNQATGEAAHPSSMRHLGVPMASASISSKLAGTISSPHLTPRSEFMGSRIKKTMAIDTNASPAMVPVPDGNPGEYWNERELKRERRKQSNRESARRSRLKKQAESEELASKVASLIAENTTLRAEMNRLTEKTGKLRSENTSLKEKLNGVINAAIEDERGVCRIDGPEIQSQTAGAENFLSKVDDEDGKGRIRNDNRENSSGKLHQLLEASNRADAVAAG